MIDYKLLNDSTVFYGGRGFTRIEVPWTVTKEVSDITRPPHAPDYGLSNTNKVLVASAEQSFLYQYVKGFLPPGRFQAITPCFRMENFDPTHTKYFMKNELIDTINVSEKGLKAVVEDAFDFFKLALMKARLPSENLEITTLDVGGAISFDIEFRFSEVESVELGSYGIRRCDFLEWVYGTGIAEPRLSAVIKKYELSLKTN